MDKNILSVDELKAFSAFERVNILAFKLAANNTAAYELEKLNVQSILKLDKYNFLEVVSEKQVVLLSC
jgi:hypothetical protein